MRSSVRLEGAWLVAPFSGVVFIASCCCSGVMVFLPSVSPVAFVCCSRVVVATVMYKKSAKRNVWLCVFLPPFCLGFVVPLFCCVFVPIVLP